MSSLPPARPASLFRPRVWLASVCFLGFIPLMEGTAASAVALVVGLGVEAWVPHSRLVLGVGVLVSAAVGFALCSWAEREAGGRDPGWFVLDEVAGMWVAMWAVPGGWLGALAAFGVFRFFDVVKPPPVKQMEGVLGSGGIMLDDLLAGVLANVVVRLGWLVAG